MKVFVTGATGFVGREILRQLHDAGHAIRILARHPDSKRVRECVAQFGAKVQRGDVLEAASLAGGLADVDAVIHLVGIISEVGANTFENVHTRGTENVVAAAQKAGVKRFIHMSALGARPNAVARYHRTKWAAEEIVRQSGIPWTIFRPSIIHGPEDQFVNLFARMARFSPVLPVMGSGRGKLAPAPVADVAACFVRALIEPRAIGQTYDLCSREQLSFVEVLDAILSVCGRKRAKLPIPMGLARAQAAGLELVYPRMLGKAPPLNRDQLIMLSEDNVGDPEPAITLFGLKPVPFREGISSYLRNKDTHRDGA